MAKILIVKLGSTFKALSTRHGDFEDWIISGSGLDPSNFQVVNVVAGASLPDLSNYAAVVLTGSHEMVTDQTPWSEYTARWLLRSIPGPVPVLGICYGHQLLARALGGMVGRNGTGSEFGTVRIRRMPASAGHPLFANLPDTFVVNCAHFQSVLKLPDGACLLAHSEKDPHAAFSVGKNVLGVQFHPEFDAQITSEYIDAFSENLRSEGQDPQTLHSSVQSACHSRLILRKFVEFLTDFKI